MVVLAVVGGVSLTWDYCLAVLGEVFGYDTGLISAGCCPQWGLIRVVNEIQSTDAG